jgi:hypothetical protein
VRKYVGHGGVQILRPLDPNTFYPHRLSHGGKVGILDAAAGVECAVLDVGADVAFRF